MNLEPELEAWKREGKRSKAGGWGGGEWLRCSVGWDTDRMLAVGE